MPIFTVILSYLEVFYYLQYVYVYYLISGWNLFITPVGKQFLIIQRHSVDQRWLYL